MHFAFSDQQTEFRDSVRQVLAKECTTDQLRAAFEHPEARGSRWATLAELGVVGLTVPDAQGGLGLGQLDLVLLLEEAGRVALPEPLADDRPGRPPAGRAGGGRSRRDVRCVCRPVARGHRRRRSHRRGRHRLGGARRRRSTSGRRRRRRPPGAGALAV